MIPKRISGATHRLGKPNDWDAEENGDCVHLLVRIEDGCVCSAWEPTPDELAMLNAGGSVILSIVGGQPPVMLSVELLEGEE